MIDYSKIDLFPHPEIIKAVFSERKKILKRIKKKNKRLRKKVKK